MRGGKAHRHGASGGFFEGETWESRPVSWAINTCMVDSECVCICVCVLVSQGLCIHTCVLAGPGGESPVLQAEGPQSRDVPGLLKDPFGRAACLQCWVEDGGQTPGTVQEDFHRLSLEFSQSRTGACFHRFARRWTAGLQDRKRWHRAGPWPWSEPWWLRGWGA